MGVSREVYAIYGYKGNYEDLKEVGHCQLSLSSDGVGKFVELS